MTLLRCGGRVISASMLTTRALAAAAATCHHNNQLWQQRRRPSAGHSSRSLSLLSARSPLSRRQSLLNFTPDLCSRDIPYGASAASVFKNGISADASAEAEERDFQLVTAAAMLPHPEKVKKGGEDAFFMQDGWIGVADGVGGWAVEMIDSGCYARELMNHCKALAGKAQGKPDPKAVLILSAKLTKAPGSATVMVAALHEHTLYVANLGDAGFIVARDGQVVSKSTPMQHDFNFPFQVGSFGDDPENAQTYEVPVVRGDIIVLATDGVFDNLFNEEIVSILKNTADAGVQEAANQVVKRAQEVGLSKDAVSPFAVAANKLRYNYRGGKLDDSTTVVAVVT